LGSLCHSCAIFRSNWTRNNCWKADLCICWSNVGGIHFECVFDWNQRSETRRRTNHEIDVSIGWSVLERN
jgi:hypothetical protein